MKFKIGIFGLGYVGLPLSIECGKYFTTIGYDQNHDRVNQLTQEIDSNNEIKKQDFKKSKYLRITNKLDDLSECNIYIVCIPTPVNKNNLPDLRNLKQASKQVGFKLKKNDIVIFESTVYPGATEEICKPILEKTSFLKLNKDFYIGYSPERVNPGDKKRKLTNIDKLVSASSKKALNIIYLLYNRIINAKVHKVSSIKVAETAKIIENTQRDINIALINQLSFFCNKININTYEVLKAAKTKWNFLNFEPGLVGGHCIGVDPYYLAYKYQKLGISKKFIVGGRFINNQVILNLNKKIKKIIYEHYQNKKIKILIMGLTFKKNCPDLRNSQIIKLIEEFKSKHTLHLFDPYVGGYDDKSTTFIKSLNKLSKYHIIIISIDHDKFKSISDKKILNLTYEKSFIFDLKNMYKNDKFITL